MDPKSVTVDYHGVLEHLYLPEHQMHQVIALVSMVSKANVIEYSRTKNEVGFWLPFILLIGQFRGIPGAVISIWRWMKDSNLRICVDLPLSGRTL